MIARNSHSLRGITLLFAVAAFCSVAGGSVIYVDDDAAGANDGASWANAHTTLQDALARASDLKGPVEIRVAGGLYLPDQGKGRTPGDVNARFELLDDVTIAGGYAGVGAVDPDARDIAANETILSGDLAGDDGPDFANYANNAQVVVSSTFNDVAAVLEGVTVTGGAGWSGPGMSCYGSGATVIDCTFRANQSIGREGGYGGAVYNAEGRPTFRRCTFEGNWAMAEGGAIWNQSRAKVTLVECTFVGNYAEYRGGAVSSFTSGVEATDCTFAGNAVAHQGGALYGYQTQHILTGCTFVGNAAVEGGGGLCNVGGSASIAGCTFTANTGFEGGGIYNDSAAPVAVTASLLAGNVAGGSGGGMYNSSDSSPKLANCTFADNPPTAAPSWPTAPSPTTGPRRARIWPLARPFFTTASSGTRIRTRPRSSIWVTDRKSAIAASEAAGPASETSIPIRALRCRASGTPTIRRTIPTTISGSTGTTTSNPGPDAGTRTVKAGWPTT